MFFDIYIIYVILRVRLTAVISFVRNAEKIHCGNYNSYLKSITITEMFYRNSIINKYNTYIHDSR